MKIFKSVIGERERVGLLRSASSSGSCVEKSGSGLLTHCHGSCSQENNKHKKKESISHLHTSPGHYQFTFSVAVHLSVILLYIYIYIYLEK